MIPGAQELRCEDGTIVAIESGFYSGIAVIDPATGGWLYEPPTDYSRGASLHVAPDGSKLWHREPRGTLSFRALQHWLATPVAARPPLYDVVIAERPELASVTAPEYDASDIVRQAPGEWVASDAIGPAARRGLVARGGCAGWQIFASGTAVLAERGGRARWIAVEPLGSSRRYTDVRCAGERAEIARFAGTPIISDGTREGEAPDQLVVDLSTGTCAAR